MSTPSPLSRILLGVALVVLAACLLGLWAVSYTAGLALTLGVVLGAVLLPPLLRARSRAASARPIALVVVALAVAVAAYVSLRPRPPLPPGSPQAVGTAVVDNYRADIAMPRPGTFTVAEKVFLVARTAAGLEKKTESGPPRTAVGRRTDSLVLREVQFRPFAGVGTRFAVIGRGGAAIDALLRADTPSHITALHFPAGLFFRPPGASGPWRVKPSYPGQANVTWSEGDLGRGITFLYLPPPTARYRPLWEPFLEFSLLPTAIVVLVGVGLSFLLTAPVMRIRDHRRRGSARSGPWPTAADRRAGGTGP